MPHRTVLITGATGFIGRRLVPLLAQRDDVSVVTLARRPQAQTLPVVEIRADLRDRDATAAALDGVDCVLHLAALTGAAPAREHDDINHRGTQSLVAACRARRVRQFIFVSSIATRYGALDHYAYAAAKHAAEAVVREAGINYLIVRPTIVLGRDAPIWRRLVALASLPFLPILGSGTARVQPVSVDDVARLLAAAGLQETLPDRAIDFGGVDVVTFEELLRRIQRRLKGRAAPVVHVPVTALMGLLKFLESKGLERLPITAGQFTAFVEDSTAAPDRLADLLAPNRISLDELLDGLTAHA
jgi:NADH dehydrogenase